MPDGTVRITAPRGRGVFINGNYTPDGDPPKIPCTVLADYGDNTFETLDGNNAIDHRGSATLSDAHPSARIKLVPVVPPEPAPL